MKTHLSFPTRDLHGSVTFYGALLQAQPAKEYDDYALFITDNPGLELALDADPSANVRDFAHYGIAVDSVEAVESVMARLQQANLPADVESETTCCYAKQTKVWTTDPDGRRWEVYAVLAERSERDDENVCCGGA